MSRRWTVVFVVTWALILAMGIYVIGYGVREMSGDALGAAVRQVQTELVRESLTCGWRMLSPSLEVALAGQQEYPEKLAALCGMFRVINPSAGKLVGEGGRIVLAERERRQEENVERALAYVAGEPWEGQTAEELEDTRNAQDMETLSTEAVQENQLAVENQTKAGDAQQGAAPAPVQEPVTEPAVGGTVYDASMLTYDFLINHFYVVDSTTGISRDQLNAGELLGMDMKLKTGADQPQILIYHTHSQEEFVDSKKGDDQTTIVGVGDRLTTLLEEKYGFHVLHDRTSYDVVNGKLDRNKAYSMASANVTKILKENPSIEVVIDLHRDGIEGDKLVTTLDGKPTAKIMFFNGLSYTNKNGAIGYLENPYIKDNLAFSLQLQVEGAKYYPGLMRKIYLKGYRYNLHLRPKSLLVEVGAQNNTLEEEQNAMEPLAFLLWKVLDGTPR